ncbi:HIT family protein [Tomitella cavernea]|uniref:HIT family protein n=2 Tax=Tomitella cavernea TaxID=1387982 RepID=A0ABP9CIZ2_9ACTN
MLIPMATVFSKIIAGEIPGRFVWSDDRVVAFLTIAPVAPGHTLIVPRDEVDNWQDVDPTLFAHCSTVAQHIGKAVCSAFDAPRAGMLIAGFEVPHLHLHVFPAADMSGFDLSLADAQTPPEQMDDAAERIRAELKAHGHGAHVADA